VLEYIDGVAIDRWCDERALDTRARVQLLQGVFGSRRARAPQPGAAS